MNQHRNSLKRRTRCSVTLNVLFAVFSFINCLDSYIFVLKIYKRSTISKMRTTLLLLFALFITIPITAQTPTEKLKITHLTGDFYIFTTHRLYQGSPFPSNGMYVITNAGAVMIDCPWDTTQFQPILDSIEHKHNSKVVMDIATHSHSDRTAGLEFFAQKGIGTYTSTHTDSLSKIKNEKRAEYHFSKDTSFTVGQYTFQVLYPGQGHTPDNIVVWFEREKILYGGCLIKSTDSPNLGNLADANVPAWDATIRTLQKKCQNPSYIIPGHQSWSSKKSLEHTLKLVKKYNRRNSRK